MGNPALTEFRDTLAATLGETLTDVGVGRLREAVELATADWSATKDRKLIRDARGVVQDGDKLITGVVEPTVSLVRITATATFVRDETIDEAHEQANRIAAVLWHPEQGPPPRGVSILQLLEQRVWWQPRNEEPVKLNDMAPSHRANLLSFLRRNAGRYKIAADYSFIGMASGPMGPGGDMATDAVESAMDELFEMPARKWIDSQPFVKRLRKLVARDERNALNPEGN